jgi:hypothetical protein
MNLNRQILLTLACLTFMGCREDRPKAPVAASPSSGVQSESTDYEGDWVFVGMAHPSRQGDGFGYAGYASIRGTEIRIHFVRSPSGAPESMRGMIPIPEEDRHTVSVDYMGKLVESDDEDFPGTSYVIQGTCFDQMPLWPIDTIPGSILVGMMDPPFMFKSLDKHPVVAEEEIREEEPESIPKVHSDPNDPFAPD